jgi:hypothetical protein
MSDDVLRPRDHAEEVALFRAEVIGALARRELSHGELAAEIRKLAKLRFRPPGRRATKSTANRRCSAGSMPIAKAAWRRSSRARARTAAAAAT